MLDAYSNNVVTLESKTGTEFNGTPKFAEPTTIPARIQYKRKLVRNNMGQEVVSEITLYTEATVKTGDRITIGDGKHIVIAVSIHNDLDGNEAFREVVL